MEIVPQMFDIHRYDEDCLRKFPPSGKNIFVSLKTLSEEV